MNDVNKYLAVLVGFVVFAVAIVWQFRTPGYRTWPYWTAVAMVAVFGTMCADVLHIVLGLPVHGVHHVLRGLPGGRRSSSGTGSERTLDIHIDRARRAARSSTGSR